MEGPIPTTAEHINIARTEEPLDNWVIQLQISEAFHDDVKASVPVVHEITTGTGEYFEYCTVRVLKRGSLRFLKRNYIRLKVVLHPSRCHEITMKGKNRGEAHTNTVEQPALRNSSNWMASCQSICMTTSKGKHFHFAGIQVVSRRDNLEFPGLHPFGEDWFGFSQLLGNVERLGAHGIVDWIA